MGLLNDSVYHVKLNFISREGRWARFPAGTFRKGKFRKERKNYISGTNLSLKATLINPPGFSYIFSFDVEKVIAQVFPGLGCNLLQFFYNFRISSLHIVPLARVAAQVIQGQGCSCLPSFPVDASIAWSKALVGTVRMRKNQFPMIFPHRFQCAALVIINRKFRGVWPLLHRASAVKCSRRRFSFRRKATPSIWAKVGKKSMVAAS